MNQTEVKPTTREQRGVGIFATNEFVEVLEAAATWQRERAAFKREWLHELAEEMTRAFEGPNVAA